MAPDVQSVVSGLAGSVAGVSWSICVRGAEGRVIAGYHADEVLPTASVGKVLLLLEVARRCEADPPLAGRRLSRHKVAPVGFAGLWQHLSIDELPLGDVAVLVGAFSDNLATNVLLDVIGLPAVARLGKELGLVGTKLLDGVRNERPEGADPPYLSVGSAAELSGVMARMAARTLVSPGVSAQLERWLATDADLSMVAGRFGLDPLAHVDPDRGLLLRHKTGTDLGTSAEVGALAGPRAAISYAVVARWERSRPDLRDPVKACFWRLGDCLRELVS